jgi:AcrR family transcriptional regulator
MKRAKIGHRIQDLIRCATNVFCEKGYRQTQMADIAKAMGVAPGTVYLYVEGKEALFDLVLRHGVESGTKAFPTDFPIPNPAPGTTMEYLRKVLNKHAQWPKLTAALQLQRAKDIKTEFREIVCELYSLIQNNRSGLILLSRSALDFPGLAELFLTRLRKRLLADLERYIRSRVNSKQFSPQPDPRIAAVFLNESIAWAAMNRMCDPEFREIPDEQMNPVAVNALVRAFMSSSKDLEKEDL